jgi:chlorobactene glucosyltransferase
MHIVVVIGLAVWLIVLANTILNLLFIRRLETGDPDGPPVSVIIPARNEERAIETTLRSFLGQDYRRLELVVVDDRSTDQTGVIADRLAAQDARVRVLHGEPPPPGWLGKPWAMHQGSRLARGELLLFVDADLVYAPSTISAAVHALRQSDSGMITLLPHMELKSFWEHVAMPMLAVAFFVMLPSWLGNRTRVVRLALGGGTGNLVRRTVYESVNGHESLKSAVVDDIGLARLLRRHGHATRVFRADHLIAIRMYHSGREIVNGFTKNVFAAFGRSYLTVAGWLAVGLMFNLLPYALAFTGDLLAIATVTVITLIRLLVFVSVRYRLDNAVLGHPLMLLFWAWIILRSSWITGVRGELQWRGRSYSTLPGE